MQPAAAAFVRNLADCVDSAVLLLIDYGFPASEATTRSAIAAR